MGGLLGDTPRPPAYAHACDVWWWGGCWGGSVWVCETLPHSSCFLCVKSVFRYRVHKGAGNAQQSNQDKAIEAQYAPQGTGGVIPAQCKNGPETMEEGFLDSKTRMPCLHVAFISDGPLVGCCYFLEACCYFLEDSGWL